MDATSNLKLPYILAAQSQKHVTHNEALRALDALVQLAALDKDLATPPVSPDEGDRYIVAASPTGAWSGQAGRIAAYQDGAWAFYVPQQGWQVWVADEEVVYVFDGTVWAAGSGGPVSLLGVNATADATNRLSLSSPASLFNHEGAGHQIKINKNAPGDTGSVLFQTGFSGRAEFGLAGDDDFHVKVSADGSAWHEALVIDRSSGVVNLPLTPRREKLTANRTYYVRTDGNNANSGLANTTGGAWATLQHAYTMVAGAIDFGGYTVTIKVADGTYTAGMTLVGPWTGGGSLVIEGNTTTKANCFIDLSTNASPFYVQATLPGPLSIRGFRMRNAGATAGSHIRHEGRGTITISALEFAGQTEASFTGMIRAGEAGARIIVAGDIGITGGGSCFVQSVSGGRVQFYGQTIPLVGTLNFSWVFVIASGISEISAGGITWDVSAATVTGKRYDSASLSLITTGGGGATYFPGSSAGSTSSGALYL